MSQWNWRFRKGSCASSACLFVAVELLVTPIAQANEGTKGTDVPGASFALLEDSALELVLVPKSKIGSQRNKALESSNPLGGKVVAKAFTTPVAADAQQTRGTKNLSNVLNGGNTSLHQRGASGVDEDSRIAMTAAGVVFGLGGLAGIGVGLIPWMQNQRAVQDGKAAIAAGPSAFPAYQAAEETVAQARVDGGSWGLLALGVGGAAFGLGMLMAVSSALLVPEGGVD